MKIALNGYTRFAHLKTRAAYVTGTASILAVAASAALSGWTRQALPVMPRPQTYVDRAAVEFATREYVNAWLANDPQRVMATLAPDAVLLPSGLPPVGGPEAIRRFWFPATGPATRVTAMDLTIDDLRVDGDLAVVSGRGTLTYTTMSSGRSGQTRTLRSWYVSVLRRQPDSRWLIARRAWSDLRH